MKHCPGCKTDLDTKCFSKNKSRPDSLQVYCKACDKVYRKVKKQKESLWEKKCKEQEIDPNFPGVHIDTRETQRLNIHEAIDQVLLTMRNQDLPAVAHRKIETGWLVTMYADDWFNFYRAWSKEKTTVWQKTTGRISKLFSRRKKG